MPRAASNAHLLHNYSTAESQSLGINSFLQIRTFTFHFGLSRAPLTATGPEIIPLFSVLK